MSNYYFRCSKTRKFDETRNFAMKRRVFRDNYADFADLNFPDAFHMRGYRNWAHNLQVTVYRSKCSIIDKGRT